MIRLLQNRQIFGHNWAPSLARTFLRSHRYLASFNLSLFSRFHVHPFSSGCFIPFCKILFKDFCFSYIKRDYKPVFENTTNPHLTLRKQIMSEILYVVIFDERVVNEPQTKIFARSTLMCLDFQCYTVTFRVLVCQRYAGEIVSRPHIFLSVVEDVLRSLRLPFGEATRVHSLWHTQVLKGSGLTSRVHKATTASKIFSVAP